ncbi:hypothetical protein [Pseudoduganella flava]|uniref:PEP-CTERM sorting domain-containing protein n=1 Tax=Pseudoduganella flava TaxID=871742 RepID=A0ABX6FRA7_9BURK|nr:hypothetical protein [Pseudoduganella flava]QGZ39196.1 hypothetical protein GO485_09170 [Pseudoduganella flava]
MSAQATGGNGGAAGVPGEAGNGGSAGAQGAGGNGGDAAASVSATGTRIIQGNAQADGGAAAGVLAGDYARHAGTAEATATLLGGSSSFVSGNVHAYGGNAGMTGGGAGPVAGGAARGAVTATGDIVALSSTVYGGTGSAASGGGAGGRGGDAEGDIHASVGSGYFSGQWRVQGGSGGNSTGGTGGAGGNARLSTQITTATTGSIDLWTYVAGGDGGDGHGLAGDSDVNLVIAAGGLGTVGGEVRSTGGRGGHGAGITGTAMQGGQGKLTANVVTQGRLQLHVSATGGAGGDGIDGHGGRGGDAIAVAAGSGHASYAGSPNELYIEATGGVGGAASAPGKRAGDGGTGHIAGTIHGTGIADAQLRATVTGGRGGTGKGQALAGNGGAAYANNNVDGSVGSDGVELYLEQKAVGGMGGFHDIGKGGKGGSAVSTLTRTIEGNHTISLRAEARGGTGGVGTIGGDGGDATASVDVTRAGTTVGLSGVAEAVGGGGGYGQPGLGGNASARSVVRAAGNASALAKADGTGWNVDSRREAPARADAFARAESTVTDASASAYATAARQEGGVAHARSEVISTGRAFAVASTLGHEGTASSYTHTTGTNLSEARAIGDVTRGGLHSASVAQHGTGLVETDARLTFGGASRWTGARVWSRAQVGSGELLESFDTTSFGYLRPDLAILYPHDPAVAGRYAGADVFAAGRMVGGGDFGATLPTRYGTSAHFVFDAASEGMLRLDLLNFRHRDAFATMEFSVAVQGAEVFRQTFYRLVDAQAFFSGGMLELGLLDEGPYDILIAADFLFGNPGWVGFDYVLAAVPEPGMWLLLAVGLVLVRVRLRGSFRV